MKGLALALLRRLGWALLVVWGVTTAVWGATALLPADPVRATLGANASPADVEQARRIWGLEEPIWRRYGRYVSRLVHAGHAEPVGKPETDHASCAELYLGLHVDLGRSPIYGKPVVELVRKKLPLSLELALGAMAIQLAAGLALGVVAAMRRGSRADRIIVAITAVLGAAPTFVIGLVLQFVLAHRLGWVPLDGQGASAADRSRAMILPALTLGLYGTAFLTRLVRAELGDALRELYVRTARAKGASPTRAALVHALRNAIGPVAQLAVLELGALMGGAIVTERLFRWPGLGEMSVVAIQNGDVHALVGVTLIASLLMVVATLLADIVALVLDPRRRQPESI